MASEEMTSGKWLRFFTDSGLPPDVAVNYAIIFADNRIQRDMLLDLTKEYLFDMGIRVMGDVIAILKHAKQVHSQEAQKKVMQSNKPSPSYNTASRMLDRYTRRTEQRRSTPQSGESVDSVVVRKAAMEEMPRPAKRRAAEEEGSGKAKQRTPSARPAATKSRSVVRPHPYLAPETPSPTIVPPRREQTQEGPTLKVVLPAGNTPRSRQILDKALGQGFTSRIFLAGTTSVTKRSVFDRLGESAVSSTTDIAHPKQPSSVFQRLGPNTDDTGGKEPSEEGLPYRGVLKIPCSNRAAGTVVRLSRTAGTTGAPGKTLTVRRSAVDPTLPAVAATLAPTLSSRGIFGLREPPGRLMLRKSISEATSNNDRPAYGGGRVATSVRGVPSVKQRLGAPVSTKPSIAARLSSGGRADGVVLRNTQPRTRTVLCADARHTVFSRLGN